MCAVDSGVASGATCVDSSIAIRKRVAHSSRPPRAPLVGSSVSFSTTHVDRRTLVPLCTVLNPFVASRARAGAIKNGQMFYASVGATVSLGGPERLKTSRFAKTMTTTAKTVETALNDKTPKRH